MIRPKVLVLLAAHDGSKWIVEQIQAILDQVGVDVDLVISDDGSTDNTRAEIERFVHDQRVQCVSPPAPTGSAAQNFLWLIRNTPAEKYAFVSFADQDDVWHDEKLVRAASTLNEQGAEGYSCAVTAFWEDGRASKLRQADTLTTSDFLFEGAGQGCTFVLSERFYERVRNFLVTHTVETALLHYHDWAIYALSRSWEMKWFFDQESMMHYRQHNNNDTGARVSFGGIGRRLNLIKDGWYARQLQVIAQICLAAAPSNPTIVEWNGLLPQPKGLIRKYRIAQFCLRGGRRRSLDKVILLVAVLAGWV